MKFDKYKLQVAKVQTLILLAGKKRVEIQSDYSRTNDYHKEQFVKLQEETMKQMHVLFADLGAMIVDDRKSVKPKETSIDWNERSYYSTVVAQEVAGMTEGEMLHYFDGVNQGENLAKRMEAVRLIGHKLEQAGSGLYSEFFKRNLQTMPVIEMEFHAVSAAADRLQAGLPVIQAFAEGILQATLEGNSDYTLASIGAAFDDVIGQAEAAYNSIRVLQA